MICDGYAAVLNAFEKVIVVSVTEQLGVPIVTFNAHPFSAATESEKIMFSGSVITILPNLTIECCGWNDKVYVTSSLYAV